MCRCTSDFAGRGAPNPFYRATFILAKAHDAVDWRNGLPLVKTYGDAYRIHSHHIFPQSLLYAEAGFDRNDFTHRRLVNEIANRAMPRGCRARVGSSIYDGE